MEATHSMGRVESEDAQDMEMVIDAEITPIRIGKRDSASAVVHPKYGKHTLVLLSPKKENSGWRTKTELVLLITLHPEINRASSHSPWLTNPCTATMHAHKQHKIPPNPHQADSRGGGGGGNLPTAQRFQSTPRVPRSRRIQIGKSPAVAPNPGSTSVYPDQTADGARQAVDREGQRRSRWVEKGPVRTSRPGRPSPAPARKPAAAAGGDRLEGWGGGRKRAPRKLRGGGVQTRWRRAAWLASPV
jgi:hypothetical protein